MTEPKKRGRPKGSGKKKVVLPEAVTVILQGTGTKLPGYAIDVEKCPDRDFQKVVASLPKLCTPATPYPSNWGSLSKVDKLQWLKSH
jgi:hypothetical protein